MPFIKKKKRQNLPYLKSLVKTFNKTIDAYTRKVESNKLSKFYQTTVWSDHFKRYL